MAQAPHTVWRPSPSSGSGSPAGRAQDSSPAPTERADSQFFGSIVRAPPGVHAGSGSVRHSPVCHHRYPVSWGPYAVAPRRRPGRRVRRVSADPRVRAPAGFVDELLHSRSCA